MQQIARLNQLESSEVSTGQVIAIDCLTDDDPNDEHNNQDEQHHSKEYFLSQIAGDNLGEEGEEEEVENEEEKDDEESSIWKQPHRVPLLFPRRHGIEKTNDEASERGKINTR